MKKHKKQYSKDRHLALLEKMNRADERYIGVLEKLVAHQKDMIELQKIQLGIKGA